MTLTHASKLLTIGALIGLLAIANARRSLASAIVLPVVALAVMAALIAPWTYRNYLVTERFIPITTNAGYNYFGGNAHWGITKPMEGPDEGWPQAALRHSGVEADVRELGRFWGLYTAELNDLIDRRMREHVEAHPADFARKFVCNAAEFYFPVAHPIYAKLHGDSKQSWPQLLRDPRTLGLAAVSAYHLALWIAALAGLSAGPGAGDRRAAWALLVLIAVFALPYFPFLVKAGFVGYTVPTLPLLSLLAARCRAYFPDAQ